MRLGDFKKYRYMLRMLWQKLLFKLRVTIHNFSRNQRRDFRGKKSRLR